MACSFNTVLAPDFQNRSSHHLLALQAQLLADFITTVDPTMATDFNSILARAQDNGLLNRTSHHLQEIIAQSICDLNTLFGGGGGGVGAINYYGTGSPEGVVTAAVGAQYLDISTSQQWGKISGVGNTGWA